MDGLKHNSSELSLVLNRGQLEDPLRILIQPESKEDIMILVRDGKDGSYHTTILLAEAQVRVLHAWLDTIV
jgi:hypothetical protein